jgi:pimeloyl-ACP methyl ester carboxylesterase
LPTEFVCQTRDGFGLVAQAGGAAGSPALLLLQGQANSHAWWNGLRSAFESEFQTITMDYRGTGSSRGPVTPWTTESFAADAMEILDSAGISTAYVYGTSMGGRVAQMIAAHYPERVTALVLACTTPGGPNAVARAQAVGAQLARTSAAERLKVLHDLFYTPAWSHPAEDSSLLGDASMTPQELAAHRKASRHHDAWDLLPSITAPTLILHGEDDLMTPVQNARLLADRIPGAGLQVYPGSRHGFFAEFAQQVSPAVLEFFAGSHAN